MSPVHVFAKLICISLRPAVKISGCSVRLPGHNAHAHLQVFECRHGWEMHKRRRGVGWPPYGEPGVSGAQVKFENVQMRYRPGLPLVLKGLTVTIPAACKAGVVGRTGALPLPPLLLPACPLAPLRWPATSLVCARMQSHAALQAARATTRRESVCLIPACRGSPPEPQIL